MFVFNNAIFKVKNITFRNIDDFYQKMEGVKKLIRLNNKKVFNIKINTEKQTIKLFNELLKDYLFPTIRIRNIKKLPEIYNNIVKDSCYEAILNKIDEAKNEYNKSTFTHNNKQYNRYDFKKQFINEGYKAILNFTYISYSDFLDIKYLDFEEIIKSLRLSEIRKNIELINILSLTSGFADKNTVLKVIEEYKKEEQKINDSFFDYDGYLKAKKELRSG